jgi:hypothetical protein
MAACTADVAITAAMSAMQRQRIAFSFSGQVRSIGLPSKPLGSVSPVSLAMSDDCSSGNRKAQTAMAQAPATSRIEGLSDRMSAK